MAGTMTEKFPPLGKTIHSDETSTPPDTPTSSQEVGDGLTLKELKKAIPGPPKRTDTSDTVSTVSSITSNDSKATDITVPDDIPVEEVLKEGTARPSVERSNSYLDIPKAVERPAPRRFRSMLDRNALANPGASLWDPTK